MTRPKNQWLFPTISFITTFILHYIYLGLFPEQDPAQSGWAVIPIEVSWLGKYIEEQNYWLGYSYGLSLAFVVGAFEKYRQSRCRASGSLAVGGLGFSGVLALAGCFLVGCCGSPMLIVWINIFGVAFLPFAKPLVAIVSTVTMAVAWWWLSRKMRTATICSEISS
jgi:hypothetical protein